MKAHTKTKYMKKVKASELILGRALIPATLIFKVFWKFLILSKFSVVSIGYKNNFGAFYSFMIIFSAVR